MALKTVIILMSILSFAVSSLAELSALCPFPENAKNLAYVEEVHIEAPLFGRTEKTVVLPSSSINKDISCVTLSGITATGARESGAVSIASIGLVGGNVSIKLVSKIKEGIDVEVAIYTE